MVTTLDAIEHGRRCEILSIAGEPDCERCLRRVGLREGATVEVLSGQDPIMVRCEGCCVALRRCMLRGVAVWSCAA